MSKGRVDPQKIIECTHKKCFPENHPTCNQCKKEIKNRWDCKSGTGQMCHQCPEDICEDCCKKVPKMEWETFHNKYIEKFAPVCDGCGETCIESEGFVEKVKGKIIAFCSHSCWEEHNSPGEWNCAIHPPVELLNADECAFTGTLTLHFTVKNPKHMTPEAAQEFVANALRKSVPKLKGGIFFTDVVLNDDWKTAR